LGDTDRSLYWLKKSGQSLRHRSVSIKKGSSYIWIGGAGDYWEDEIGIDRAFEGVPKQECKILLAHNPDSIDTNYETRLDLTIAGHTHGGQVNIPFFGTPVLPVINKAYSSGLIRTNKKNIYISRGLGWAIIPVRFNCFPEISVLRLFSDTQTT
jgi:predicted MPP superfamily phosphohydrolase